MEIVMQIGIQVAKELYIEYFVNFIYGRLTVF